MNQKATLAAIGLTVISLILTGTTYAAMNNTTLELSSEGRIIASPDLAIYSDAECTTPLTSINWGSLSAGETVTKTAYIKNTGNGTSLLLSMTTSDWAPPGASSYIQIAFNPSLSTIVPGVMTPATLTLTVSPNVIDVTNFNVKISITGTPT